MTSTQLKSEIKRVIDNLPESTLNDILAYLKLFESKSPADQELALHLRKIIEEDKKLLERLAE